MKRLLNTFLLVSLAMLSLASAYINLTFSGAEPLFEFVLADVLLWVAGGAILSLLFIEWSAMLLILLARGQVSRLWGAAIPWAILNIYYMTGTCLQALQDLERFALGP